jgi:hypothetical protein
MLQRKVRSSEEARFVSVSIDSWQHHLQSLFILKSLCDIKYFCSTSRSQCFPLQVTGWPLELMAYAYLAVSPPSMSRQFEEVCQIYLLS